MSKFNTKEKNETRTHPTHDRLIASTQQLLNQYPISEITTEMVLVHSGVSRGSLYHHFNDMSDLLAKTLYATFSELADQNIKMIEELIEKSHSQADFIKSAHLFNKVAQAPDRRGVRFDRLRLISLASENEQAVKILEKEQKRLTAAYKLVFETAQENGWIAKDIDAHAAAVFIQAYTFGRVIDDISEDKVDPAAWESLLMKVVERVFSAP